MGFLSFQKRRFFQQCDAQKQSCGTLCFLSSTSSNSNDLGDSNENSDNNENDIEQSIIESSLQDSFVSAAIDSQINQPLVSNVNDGNRSNKIKERKKVRGSATDSKTEATKNTIYTKSNKLKESKKVK